MAEGRGRPNSPWYGDLVAWTGTEVLLFGGPVDHGGAHGPASKLRTERAAGAYDPQTESWRQRAVAPFSLARAQIAATSEGAYALSFDKAAFGLKDGRLWEYSVALDSWRRLADPPMGSAHRLAVSQGRVIAWTIAPTAGTASAFQIYDPATDRWQAGPTPAADYGWRHLVALADGRLVAIDAPAGAPDKPTAKRPSPTWRAAVLDVSATAWRSLPDSSIPVGEYGGGNAEWTAIGNLVVNGDPRTIPGGTVDGSPDGEVSLGGVLDPTAGRWETLPDLPGTPHIHRSKPKDDPNPDIGYDTRDLLRADGPRRTLAYGWSFDPAGRTWTEVESIPGDEYGLRYSTEVWAGDVFLYWANAKTVPVPKAGPGAHTDVREQVGWSWSASSRRVTAP
ncbi:MAG: hypothetical protein ACT4QG_12250 [Sporichthyaceae bacterium]